MTFNNSGKDVFMLIMHMLRFFSLSIVRNVFSFNLINLHYSTPELKAQLNFLNHLLFRVRLSVRLWSFYMFIFFKAINMAQSLTGFSGFKFVRINDLFHFKGQLLRVFFFNCVGIFQKFHFQKPFGQKNSNFF